MDNRAIGVFDSGLGGLTAVRQLHRVMPNESIIYFGDTGRVPYVSRSRRTVLKYARQDVAFLKEHNLKAIVIACGTVSSQVLGDIKSENTVPIVGVVEPTCYAAMQATKNNRIGIIGTKGTIRSGAYEAKLHTLDPSVHTIARPCPLFVPLVENGRFLPNDRVTKLVVEEYLTDIRDFGVDTLILGCTHYPLLTDIISAIMGPEVTLVSAGEESAFELKRMLKAGGLRADESRRGEAEFYVSDRPEDFERIASVFLQEDLRHTARRIDIDQY